MVDKAFDLIKRGTDEIIGEDELKDLLKKKKKISIYWGTAPTGRPHVGYFIPGLKISDFLKAGCEVIILLADIHAALDNTPWDILEKRYKYYEKVIPLMIKAMGANTKNLKFVKGSSFQLKEKYFLDLLKLSSFTTLHDSNKAASEVVKQGDNPKVSGLIYPLMQALDEEYLKVDAQLGGTDQRKIMVLAREKLPKIGYKSRIEIINPILPGLIGEKMSSSIEGTKIDFLDDEETVKRKINKADCVAGDTNNGLLAFLNYVIFSLKDKFVVERPEKFGGNLEYKNYEEVKKNFISKKLHPLDLKNALSREINLLLGEIRKHTKELEKLSKDAYG